LKASILPVPATSESTTANKFSPRTCALLCAGSPPPHDLLAALAGICACTICGDLTMVQRHAPALQQDAV